MLQNFRTMRTFSIQKMHMPSNLAIFTIISILITFLYMTIRKQKFYLRDFTVFKAPASHYTTGTQMLQIARDFDFSADSATFVRRLHARTGLGPKVAVPLHLREQKHSIADARNEVESVMFSTLDELFKTSKIRPDQIQVVVTNCSLFCPTPSMGAMIVNKYKMSPKTHVFSLGGMGCGAGPVAVDCIRQCMASNNLKYGVLFSTENMTQHFYNGEDRSMLLPNTLFRMGGAAMLFTNKRKGAKYELKQLVKTHFGAVQDCFEAVYQDDDGTGKIGIRLDRKITKCAQLALTDNLKRLLPKILPATEILRFLSVNLYRKMKGRKMEQMPRISSAVDKFCFHCGGRGVLDGMQEMFQLNDKQMSASRAALWRYGNTSSASIWYGLAYQENHQIKKGDNIWQIAFGSGFKANSIVWKCLGVREPTVFDLEGNWDWEDVVERVDEIDEIEMKRDYYEEDAERVIDEENKEYCHLINKFGGRIDSLKSMCIRDVKEEVCDIQ